MTSNRSASRLPPRATAACASRSGRCGATQVNAIVEGGRAVLPLVTLNFPDRDASAPPTMIALGLSAEAEAERVVQTALASFINLRPGVSTGARIMVLAGAGALERRVAQAYVNALRAAGELPLIVEATPAALNRLGRQFETGSYDAVFLALGRPRGVAGAATHSAWRCRFRNVVA